MTTIILCGGAGTRLWPLSRQKKPKQFADLLGGPSLYERTIARNAPLSDRLMVVTNALHRDLARMQLDSAAPGAAADYILEPCGRNTAPAIALACLARDPSELVLVVPSDQVIRDEAAYRDAVARASAAAGEGGLVTFGLKPEYPETGFGYIEAESAGGAPFLPVKSFKEKPDAATAAEYVAAGRYYWNSGMFAFKAGRYLEELGKSRPDILEASRAALRACPTETLKAGRVYAVPVPAMMAIPSESIDYAVMERCASAAVVPCSIGWSDLGSWDAIHEIRGKDEAGNVRGQESIAIDSSGNLAVSGGKPVVLIGVEDLIVVDSGDALLVMRRGRSQDVKKAVDALKQAGRSELL